MKKLVKIRLINWHYLANQTIEINGNTLLTGPNASGKSTILDAITYILTCGEANFNLAANEKGKRDLRSYVKCKLGIDDKEYLRNGDVSGHIALEFFDEKSGLSFTVGSVIDAFGEILPVKSIFYKANTKINDSMFISNDRTIYGTTEFRKNNPDFEYYLTKSEAKRGFRNAFGSINEDFYKLIPKALAFKPIADVKQFIYQNILEEKEIDVTAIQDSIRAYKELEATLKLIQAKIADLHEIDIIYQEILKIQENKSYLEYLMHLFDVEKVRNEIQEKKKAILKEEAQTETQKQAIRDIENEKINLQERARSLYNMLSNNETFKASEYVANQIIKTQANIESLEENEQRFLKRTTAYNDTVAKLKKLSNEKFYSELSQVNLSLINTNQVEDTKVRLKDISGRLNVFINKKNQDLGKIQSALGDVVNEISEISAKVRNLSQNKLNYNPHLTMMRQEIQEGLRRVYNYDVNVHILAELCEITDPEWADAVEVYLGNRRFNMIVEPRYFDQALQIFNRIKSKYKLYGIGLVNTKQISKFTTFEKNSIASIIDTENTDARCFINYTAGNVIMVDDVTELENYSTSITKDLLIYRGYTVSALNPNVDRPFMGKNAVKSLSKQMNDKALEAKSRYNELNAEITTLMEEIELLDSLNINPLIEDLNKVLELQKERHALEDLKKEEKRSKKATTTDIEDDYAKVQDTIKKNDERKMQISMDLGGSKSRIEAYNAEILLKTKELEDLTQDLKKLAGDNAEIVERAKAEYQHIIEKQSFKSALSQYEERYRIEQNVYDSSVENIVARQYAYVNKYNSTLTVGMSEIGKFRAELNKLEKSELIKHEQKVRQARESAEVVFREDFIAKLRNNILTAEQEIAKINKTLKNIKFGSDRYEFFLPRSTEYAAIYDMVTSDLADINQGLFTYEFQNKYDEQIKLLFDKLAEDELNSNGHVSAFTDYRTYMDYDIKIVNEDGDTMTYSKVFKEKSGGETQVPFYVAIIASFVRVYTKTSFVGGDPIGIVMFDEVFDKMDSNRMKAMMNFITSMPLQVIIACPPQRMESLQDFADTTLVMVRQGTQAKILSALKNNDKEAEEEEE